MVSVYFALEKAQDSFASMAPEACLSYDLVKSAVLKAYEPVPKAYRQEFRRLKKRNMITKLFVNLGEGSTF